jgi:GNAT superfamily N-acetyltransferase
MKKSGYYWLKVTDEDGIVAFANYGKNAFSTHSWDLYWIAVHQASRHKKLGTALLRAIEEDVRKLKGKILWIETSGRPLYASTEAFYRRNGYELQASLKDFYGPGDPKQIYSKVLL